MPDSKNGVRISEIFTSIEGEGIFSGTKTMFIRLAGCHLKCRWCDTEYALPLDSGRQYSINEAIDLIEKHIQPFTYKVNFTGGEPLLQHRALISLADFIKTSIGLRTYIESSCFDSQRFSEIVQYFDICKIEFKTPDSGATTIDNYKNLLRNEFECLDIAQKSNKLTFIKVVTTRSTSKIWLHELVHNIFEKNTPTNISGFVIQPSYGTDEPTFSNLIDFYDIVFPFYPEVRIIPQLHKELCAR